MNPEDFSRVVRTTVERYEMDVSRPLAMVSGGPDSVALLRVILDLGVEPIVLHVDYGLREESQEDAGFVRELCRGLGVRCEVRSVSLDGPSVQEAAREERYRLSEEMKRSHGLSSVVTGHTANDVAETVLLNLARGAGLRGLSGIPPVRGVFARPLIEHGRAEVLAYLDYLAQPYRTDPTNLQPKYARNRVRLEVLPALEELHPGAATNIARGAAFLRGDLEVLEGFAAEVVERRGRESVVPLGKLRELSPALRRYAARRAYALALPGAGKPLGSAHVKALLELTKNAEGTQMLDLPGGVVAAVRGSEELALYERGEVEAGGEPLRVGESGFGGWAMETRKVRGFDPEDTSRPMVAYLDAGGGPYSVRMAREADSIRPLGLGGTKKVMRAMMDRKVPKDLRRVTPVVVGASGEIAWVFGGELDEEFKVKTETAEAIRLEVKKIR